MFYPLAPKMKVLKINFKNFTGRSNHIGELQNEMDR